MTSASYASATIGSTSTTLDVNHPYYLHPSDNPGLIITTKILDENNYSQWERSMDIALSSKLKLGFVDGTYVQPAANSSLFIHWTRCNNMVTSWLLNAVTSEIRQSIVYMKSAKLIWDELKVRYAQTNVPKLSQLRKEIAHLTQGTMSVGGYFTKFKTLHNELESLHSNPRCICNQCTCTVNTKLDVNDLHIQTTQFLMGLSESFTAIRGQILIMKPLPTLSQCYSMLLQEENQREVKGSTHTTAENVALSVKTKPQFQRNFKKQSEVPIYCEYCRMQGHSKDKCYCLHGYPTWHKLHGKPKPKPKHLTTNNPVAAQVNTDISVNDYAENEKDKQQSGQAAVDGFSDTLYKQLLQLFQQNFKGKEQASQADISPYTTVNSAQFAGTTLIHLQNGY